MPAYNPPSGATTDFDLSTGVQAYNPPNGQYVDFDHTILEDVFNPYIDTGSLSSGGVTFRLRAHGGYDSISTSALKLGVKINLPLTEMSLHINNMPDFRIALTVRGTASGGYDSVLRKGTFTLSSGVKAFADFYLKDGRINFRHSIGFAARGIPDALIVGATRGNVSIGFSAAGSTFIKDTSTRFVVKSSLRVSGIREFEDVGKAALGVSFNLRASNSFFLQSTTLFLGTRLRASATLIQVEGNVRMTCTLSSGNYVRGGLYVHDVFRRFTVGTSLVANGYYDKVPIASKTTVAIGFSAGGDTRVFSIQGRLRVSVGGRADVVADMPPVYVSSPETGVVPGRYYAYKPQVIDDYSTPTVYPGVLPSFLSFSNGTVSGTVPYGNLDNLVVSTYARDDIGSITTQTYLLEVLTPFRTNDLKDVRLYLDNAPARVVTVELTGLRWADQTPRVFYFSNAPYVSWPDDNPWNKSFSPLIKDIPAFSRSLNANDFSADTSWGEVTVINNGGLDSLLTDYTTRFRPINIRIGEQMTSYSSFITVIQGCLGERGVTSSSYGAVSLPIRSNAILLEVPLSEDKWSKDDKLNPEKGKPECWGGTVENPVFNIAPVLIDDANHRYKYHNGKAGGVVKVRDLGVEVEFDDFPLLGEFELRHPPKGDITADVVGGFSKDGKQYSNLVELLYALVIDKTPVTPEMIDTNSFRKLTRMYRNAIGGFYYTEGGASTVREVATWILSSINSYFEFRRNGNMYVREMFEQGYLTKDSSLTIDYLFTLDEVGHDIALSDVLPAMYEVPFGWKKNWNPQTTFADYIHEEALSLKTLYEEPHTKIVKTNADVQARVVKPEKLDVWESLLLEKDTAEMVAQLRADLRKVDRRIYTVKVFKFASLLNLGDIIRIDTPRYNLYSYPVIVVGIEDPIISQVGQIKIIQ